MTVKMIIQFVNIYTTKYTDYKGFFFARSDILLLSHMNERKNQSIKKRKHTNIITTTLA